MNNPTLDKIKNFAVKELKNKYGFCGLADGDDMCIINATDSENKDIIIKIEIKK